MPPFMPPRRFQDWRPRAIWTTPAFKLLVPVNVLPVVLFRIKIPPPAVVRLPAGVALYAMIPAALSTSHRSLH